MKIRLPVLEQTLDGDTLVSKERDLALTLDTSVYSEERWEQHFPTLAAKEGLFEYISRVQENAVGDRVRVACMLKAIYCFIESEDLPSYKDFAQMFNLATPEYTERMINSLRSAFKLILNGSSTKN